MKLVRAVILALLVSLLVGLAIGTLIRMRLERPVRYVVGVERSATPAGPLDIGQIGTAVLDTRNHEEQIG